MYISKVVLRNWKNFNHVDARLKPRVFLIGPNASGKSNLLDALRFLFDVANDGLEKAVKKRNGISAIRCLSARQYSNIDIDIEITDGTRKLWRYFLSISQDNLQHPVVKHEIIYKKGSVVETRPNSEDEQDSVLLTQTYLEQISRNQKFREVAGFLKTISYQHLIPQVVRDPHGFSPETIHNDPFGRDFLLRMWNTRKNVRDSRLGKISQALKGAVPQLNDMQVTMDEKSGTPHLIAGYSHWRPRLAKQDESQFSDGTLRLIGLLWTVYEGLGPLLIEEPEISLHPEVVQRLPLLFQNINRSRKESRQIIISTHSYDLLRDEGIGPDEIIRLEPTSNGTRLIMPDKADQKAMKAGLTAADVLMPKAAPKNIHQLTLF